MVQTMFEFTNEKVDTIFGGVKPALIMFINKQQHLGSEFMEIYKKASY